MLFHDMGKPVMKTTDENGRDHFKGHAIASEQIAKTVMKRLKFDNDTIRKVTKLVAYHDYRMEPTGANVDLINLGIAPGKELGTLLNELLDMVIEDPAWNQKGKLCDYVKERFGF